MTSKHAERSTTMSFMDNGMARVLHDARKVEMAQARRATQAARARRMQRRAMRMTRRAQRAVRRAEQAASRARLSVARAL
jgi:hypothetical protein